MARDPGLEQLIREDLTKVSGLSEKSLFGGWAWLLDGKMFCAARDDGMLARVGDENSRRALLLPGIIPMISRGKRMPGWVRLKPQAYGDDALRRRMLEDAAAFTRSLGSCQALP
ncbi:TfoX/Sxy family protein [Chelativorans sp.]|uniref:TfoX/Sxy family protein n=1 Tax=Chelativorans sp. TaxID=2203393 RepID=UPI002810C6F5|nr:TfoX/Sxy family protein [Chelativorans sp.]